MFWVAAYTFYAHILRLQGFQLVTFGVSWRGLVVFVGQVGFGW